MLQPPDPRHLLAKVCILTARIPDARAAVQAITDLLADHLGSRIFEVWLCRGDGSLDLMARSVSDAIPSERREPLKESSPRALIDEGLPVAHAARSGQGRTWAVDDPELDPACRDNLVALEVGEVRTIPVRDSGTVLGVAVVTPAPARSVTDEDEEVLSVVLGNVAILLGRIHHLESHTASAEELYRLNMAIQSLPVVVKILSPDWVIESVNPAVRKVFGYSPDELVGKHISMVRDMDGAGSRQAAVAAAVRDGPWIGDMRGRHRDGHVVPVRLIVAPLRSAQGDVTGIVEVARDLSREVEQESRAKDAYKMAVVGRLAATVAHEVNNPLASITMMTRVLLDDDLPEHLRHDLELINSEAHRAGAISRNLLVFARRSNAARTAIDIEPIVREVIRLKLPELRLSEITVEVTMVGEPPAVMANAGEIRQVLHNLLSNSAQAIQENKERGWIGITVASAEANWVDVTVEDDGPGIPAEVLDRVMSPFFTTKIVGKGTGLGLSVCRDIVESSGGEIRISNRDDENLAGSARPTGVRVSVRVPAAERAGEVESAKAPASPEVTGSARILIIDDDAAVASTLKRLVERMGYTAEITHRGEAALNRIESGERFDLILSDLKMPGIGGEGVYRELERVRPELLKRFVLMSGDLTPEVDHEFLRNGSFVSLEKPFTRERLRDTLESALKRR